MVQRAGNNSSGCGIADIRLLLAELETLRGRFDRNIDAIEDRITQVAELGKRNSEHLRENIDVVEDSVAAVAVKLDEKVLEMKGQRMGMAKRISDLETACGDGRRERDQLVTTLQDIQQRQSDETVTARTLERLDNKISTCETLHYGNTGEIVNVERKLEDFKFAVRDKIDLLTNQVAEIGNLHSSVEDLRKKTAEAKGVADGVAFLNSRCARIGRDQDRLEENHGQTISEVEEMKQKVRELEEISERLSPVMGRLTDLENKVEELEDTKDAEFKNTLIALVTGLVEMTQNFKRAVDKRTREGSFAVDIDQQARRILDYATSGELKVHEATDGLDEDSMRADTPLTKRPRWSISRSI